MDKDLLSTAAVKQREGWTEAAIRRFCGEPDQIRPNPYRRTRGTIKLWSLTRVEAVEKSSEFTAWKLASGQRRAAAIRRTEDKKRELMREVEHMNFSWSKPVPKKKLFAEACEAYNERNWDADELAHVRSDTKFLHRITVNYLRHSRSDYEKRIEQLYGRVGTHDAYLAIKIRALEAFAQAYPYLAEEVERQKDHLREAEEERQAFIHTEVNGG